ncbi:MAG: hypothetical protein ACF8CQ_18455 [Rhodopirellula sp. JB044]|uniref:hypothetical protein n=1 Tax=Rhodopirellula sp. JB044 TaxID=3342844 RepID=UPI00370C3F28
MQRELADTWQTDPPAFLKTAVNRHVQKLRLAEKQEELLAAAKSIQESMDQFDEEGTRHAVAHYVNLRNEGVEEFGSSVVNSEAEAIATPGIEHVSEQNAEQQRVASRNSAIAMLESTMDRLDANVPQIESAYQKAIAFDEPLPPELFNRYRATIDDLKTRGKRKFQLAIGGIAVVTMLLIGMLVTWQIRRNHVEKVATVSGQLRRILESGALDDAKQFIDAVRRSQPELASDPKVAELIVLHQSMTQKEKDRKARFDQQLAELEAVNDESLDDKLLSRLEEEATTDDEKIRVLEQRDRYERFVNSRRKEQTESLMGALRATGNRLAQQSKRPLSEFTLPDLRGQSTKLDGLIDEIKRSIADFPYASLSAKQEGENQVRRIIALKTRLKEHEITLVRSSGAAEHLLAARSLSNLKSRMKDYVAKLPLDQRSAEFRRTLDSAEFWQTAELWNRHLGHMQDLFTSQFKSQAISSVSQSGKELSELCSKPPFETPKSITFCIDHANERHAILKKFEEFLDRSLFSQIISVTQKGGEGSRVYLYKNFYDRERDKFDVDDVQPLVSGVEVIQTGDGAIKSQTLNTPLVIEREPFSSLDELKKKWGDARVKAMADWDGEMLKWLAILCRREKLDATIKEILLAQAIQKIQEGSIAREQFVKIHNALLARRAAWEDWYRPASRSVRSTDIVIQKIIPALSSLYRKHQDPRDDAKLLSQMRIRPVGIWDVAGKSELNGPASSRVIHYWERKETLKPGILMVVRRDPTDPLKCRWIRFAEFEKDQMKVTDSSIKMTAGEPIFLSSGPQAPIALNLPQTRHTLVSVYP